MAHDYEYIGSELELFAHAVNWKACFAEQLQPSIRGRVLEVGAGIGATTRGLCNRGVTAWKCLEPDARLAATLKESIAKGSDLPAVPVDVVVGSIADLSKRKNFDTILVY